MIAHESWSEWTDRSVRGRRWSSRWPRRPAAPRSSTVSVVPTLEYWPVGFGMAAYSAAMPALEQIISEVEQEARGLVDSVVRAARSVPDCHRPAGATAGRRAVPARYVVPPTYRSWV